MLEGDPMGQASISSVDQESLKQQDPSMVPEAPAGGSPEADQGAAAEKVLTPVQDVGAVDSSPQSVPEAPPVDKSICISCDCPIESQEEALCCNKGCHAAHLICLEDSNLNSKTAKERGKLMCYGFYDDDKKAAAQAHFRCGFGQATIVGATASRAEAKQKKDLEHLAAVQKLSTLPLR